MKHDYEILIIGSGFAGSMLAAILARNSVRVCLIEAGSHPRFAIGESTLPHTSQMISLLSRKFGVPELEYLGLGSPQAIQTHITSSCGIKRLFGFAHHNLGCEADPTHAHQFGNVFRDENHLFRQDIDSYLAQVAVRYGADLLLRTAVTDFEITDTSVQVKVSQGRSLSASYLVDAAGFRSPIAAKYDLRDPEPRFRHHSRSIFTHMIDVEPFEDVAPNYGSCKWSEGTLHHVFEGGWLWVIPFNNRPGSTNALVSVGLTLDPRRWPADDGLTPEREFFSFIEEHLPSAALQFRRAKAMQPWVSTGRLQYSSKQSVGDRWCLMSHSSGFLDPLYSRGLISTVEVVGAAATALLESHQDGDYSEERFAPIEDLHRRIHDFADRLVASSFSSWKDFEVWDRMVRIWAIAVGCVESNLGSFLILKERAPFPRAGNPLFSEFEEAGFRKFFESCEPLLLDFEHERLSAASTAEQLQSRLDAYDFRLKIPDGTHCVEWGLKNPTTRDWFVGSDECRSRWEAKLPDPHLA